MSNRPNKKDLIGKPVSEVPMSLQRIIESDSKVDSVWIGPNEAAKLSDDENEAYEAAEKILCHIAVEAPIRHKSGHPGGSMSAFTFGYWINKLRNPHKDQPLRMSAGHLSIFAFTLQWLFGHEGTDKRLASPEKIIDSFRTPSGLPGHAEAGVGDIPFGAGPLGKGVSNALGVAFGLKYQKKDGIVDVLLADGDAQEGQVMEAFRLATQLKLDNLVVHGDWNDVQLSGMPSEVFASDFAEIAIASGWQVIEVQNGNDPSQVKAAIEKANEFIGKGKPIFICYYTTMGNGISFMEEASNTGSKNYHGAPLSADEKEKAMKELPKLDELIKTYEKYRTEEKSRYESADRTVTDIEINWNPKAKKIITTEKGAARKDFGATHLLNLMKEDDRIIVLHADLAGSGGFDKAEAELPNRVINVGVAEANMYMSAAGMRQTGLLPVTYTFAAFGTNEARANARLIDVNCGHTRCGVLHDCTHCGLSVGEDGETHQERHYLDIPFDNTEVWTPADSNQAAAMAEKGIEKIAEGHKSIFVFSPRNGHEQLLDDSGKPIYGEDYEFDGKATMLEGKGNLDDKITIISSGIAIHESMKAIELLKKEKVGPVRLINIASVRPIDAAAIIQAALETVHLLVVEDHSSESGIAAQVADVIADFQLPCSLRRLGVNTYFPSAPSADLFLMAGIDAESIADAVQDEIGTEVCGGEDAFMSVIHSLSYNIHNSRFKGSATEFVEKLKDEKYLSTLRDKWEERECNKEDLPSNKEIIEQLL